MVGQDMPRSGAQARRGPGGRPPGRDDVGGEIMMDARAGLQLGLERSSGPSLESWAQGHSLCSVAPGWVCGRKKGS